MTVEQVKEQCDAYVEEEGKKLGTKLVTKCKNGYYWVELTFPLAIRGEGHNMNNCLKLFDRYSESVANGTIRLFSLRDKNDNPHVDIEYNVPEKQIIQLKGKANTIPKEEYRMMVIDFLNSLDIDDDYLSIDIAQMWLAKADGKYVDLLDAIDDGTVFDDLVIPPSFTQKYPELNTLVSKKDIMITSVRANYIKSLIAGHIHILNSSIGEIQTISVKKGCYFSRSKINTIYNLKSADDVCNFMDSHIQDINNIECYTTIVLRTQLQSIQNIYAKKFIVVKESTVKTIHMINALATETSDSTVCLTGKSRSAIRPMFKSSNVSFKAAVYTKLGFEDCTITLDSLSCKEISLTGKETKVIVKNPSSTNIGTVLLGHVDISVLESLIPIKDSIVIEADAQYKKWIQIYGFQYRQKKVEITSFEHFSNYRYYYGMLYDSIPKNKGVMLVSAADNTSQYKEFCSVVGSYLLNDL